MTNEYANGVLDGKNYENKRIVTLLETERKKFVFNSTQSFILDEMLKLIRKNDNEKS